MVHFTGALEDGEEFDSSLDGDPMEFRMGGGDVLAGFENAVRGMAEGEKKTFTLNPEESYGEWDEDLIHVFDRDSFPRDANIEVGDSVAIETEDGEQLPAWVSDVNDEEVEVDMNHPLAGHELTFQVEVIAISDTPSPDYESDGGECGCGCGGRHCGD
jgi:peptidylprolyl isomerase